MMWANNGEHYGLIVVLICLELHYLIIIIMQMNLKVLNF